MSDPPDDRQGEVSQEGHHTVNVGERGHSLCSLNSILRL
jgi:hypothetical protein